MNPLYLVILSISGTALVTSAFLTALFYSRIMKWRMICIQLEHDLARAHGRQPRHIDQLTEENTR